MKFFRDYLPLDVLIALLVLLLAGTASAFIFERISLEREDRTVTLSGLEIGERTFELQSSKGCAGSFNVSLAVSRESSTLKLDGVVRLIVGNRSIAPVISGEVSFNNLGQLGGSIFRLSAEGMEVVLGTTGLRKMKAVLRSTIGGAENRFEIPVVAGPFLLARQPDGKYSITGPGPEGMKGFQPGTGFVSSFSSYSFRVRHGRSSCSAEGAAAVDLNPLLTRFQSIFHL